MHGGTLRTLRIALRQEVLRQREWSIVSKKFHEEQVKTCTYSPKRALDLGTHTPTKNATPVT